MPIPAVIYCRSACRPSVGPDTAIQKQELICRERASSSGFEIIKTFYDSGVSGNSENRLGFNTLLAFLSQYEKAITVLVSSPDRIARDFRAFSMLERKLSNLKASLAIMDENFMERA